MARQQVSPTTQVRGMWLGTRLLAEKLRCGGHSSTLPSGARYTGHHDDQAERATSDRGRIPETVCHSVGTQGQKGAGHCTGRRRGTNGCELFVSKTSGNPDTPLRASPSHVELPPTRPWVPPVRMQRSASSSSMSKLKSSLKKGGLHIRRSTSAPPGRSHPKTLTIHPETEVIALDTDEDVASTPRA